MHVLPSPEESALSKPIPQWVVFHDPGPRWQRGVPPFEQEGLQAHVDHYRELLKNGKLALGGPFLDDNGGGMMVAAVGVGAAELAAVAAADPTVASGLLTFRIRPWLIGMRAAD
jgi:uncharacterized protein YciI